ncbi:MAG: hypothetical protein MZV70_53220 [Desulfobacterales bacterium]|nr:hypothetical protein [Desulfobacterales bacterium]
MPTGGYAVPTTTRCARRSSAAGSRIPIPAAADLRPAGGQRGRAPRPAGAAGGPAGRARCCSGNIYDLHPRRRHRRSGAGRRRPWCAWRCSFAIPLDRDPAKPAAGIRCHNACWRSLFSEVFRRIVAGGLRPAVRTYGGCYQYPRRAQRLQAVDALRGASRSTSTSPTNGDGQRRRHGPAAGRADGRAGLRLGRPLVRGTGKDPMHFQYQQRVLTSGRPKCRFSSRAASGHQRAVVNRRNR